jgi:tetratricopeptide (TPR) repeat protein
MRYLFVIRAFIFAVFHTVRNTSSLLHLQHVKQLALGMISLVAAVLGLAKAVELLAPTTRAALLANLVCRPTGGVGKIVLSACDPNVWVKRGDEISESELDEAINDYTYAIELDPKNVDLLVKRMDSYNDDKNFQKALTDINSAINLEPDNAWLYTGRGWLYRVNANEDNEDNYKKLLHNSIEDYTEAIRLESDYAGAFYGRAMACSMLNDYKSAIEDFNSAVRLYDDLSDKKDALHYLGHSYEANGDIPKAIKSIMAAYELDKSESYYLYEIGLLYEKDHAYREALSYLTNYIEKSADNEEVFNERGALYSAHGKELGIDDSEQRALTDFDTAIRLNDKYYMPYANKAIIYYNRKDYDTAIAYDKAAIELNNSNADVLANIAAPLQSRNKQGDMEESIKYLSEAVKSAPHVAKYLLLRSAAYEKAGKLDEAVADAASARTDVGNADAAAMLGALHVDRGDSEEAVKNLDEAISKNESNSDLYALRCQAKLATPKIAMHDCETAVRLDQSSSIAHSTRCMVYILLGDVDDALNDCNEAINIDQENGIAHFRIGLIYLYEFFKHKNEDGAENWIRKAMRETEMAMQYAPTFHSAHVMHGFGYIALNDLTRAIADFENVKTTDKEFVLSRMAIAHAYELQENNDMAIAELSKALEKEPHDVSVLNKRGVLKFNKKDYPGAVADFEEATRFAENDAMIYINLCNSYYKLQDGVDRNYDGVKKACGKVIEIDDSMIDAYVIRAAAHKRANNIDLYEKDMERVEQILSHVDEKTKKACFSAVVRAIKCEGEEAAPSEIDHNVGGKSARPSVHQRRIR